MSRVIVKAGDTHATTWTANTNLTGATVRLIAQRTRGGSPVVLPSSVTNAVDGLVTHNLTGTLPVGVYEVELEITKSGVIATAPTSGYATLEVQPDLD